jgi:signal transduction histidine kinase
MAVELAEVAAGLPIAASFALASGITGLREGRRRTSLNEAMHELRRPLQVLSLALPAHAAEDPAVDSTLRLATAALERLDHEINGRGGRADSQRLSLQSLLVAGVRRWEKQALIAGKRVRLGLRTKTVYVRGRSYELTQALDNLISNALEHGGPQVTIEARERDGWAMIVVRDGGAAARPRSRRARPRSGSRSRRGHGLRVVARVAREHGGEFSLRRCGLGAEAAIRLPLADGGGRR